MISSTRAAGLLKIFAALVILCWTLSYLGFSSPDYHTLLRHFRGEKARFVEEFLRNDVGGPIEGEAIAALCSNRTWTKGLLFQCEPPPGGIGEVRNAHLNCIRFAMEAGAGLIMPEIIKRNDRDIAKVVPDTHGIARGVPLDYFYDREHLTWALSEFCPQMQVVQSIDELYNVPMGNPVTVSVSIVGMEQVNGTLMKSPEAWTKIFLQFINAKSSSSTRTWPFKVIVGRNTYVWPTTYDSPAFVRNFGRILRFRQDIRELAASASYALKKRGIIPPPAGVSGSSPNPGYAGIHMRTEKDVWGTEFPIYEEQAAYYLAFLSQSPYHLAYMASGATQANLTAFAARASDFNVTVVTKRDLLDAEELRYLADLTWDQQALVDYEMLLRSGHMAGISASSFSWNIALRRAANAGHVGSRILASASPVDTEFIKWQDGRSAIVGKEGAAHVEMQLGIWP